MARYLVLERSFIGHGLVEPGTEIEYDGEAGPNLQPLDAPKKAETKAKPDAALA